MNMLGSKAPTSGTRRHQRRPGRPAQSGVGLIEVMIAVLVLSIGFLGVGALLASSLSTNNSAMARSMATVDSYSILDAMRADLANAKGGAYDGTVTAGSCPSAPSTGGTLAVYQLSQWCNQLAHDLGDVATTTGTVTCDSAGKGICTVVIQFDDSRAGVGGSKKQIVTTKAML